MRKVLDRSVRAGVVLAAAALVLSVFVPTPADAAGDGQYPVPLTPTGNVANEITFSVKPPAGGASWYQIWVQNAAGELEFEQWFPRPERCDPKFCDFKSPVLFATGHHYWWARSWNDGTYSPWSSAMKFNKLPQARPDIVSPSVQGTVSHGKAVELKWDTALHSTKSLNTPTWGRVSVYQGSELVSSRWQQVDQSSGCVTVSEAKGELVECTDALNLPVGEYSAWAQFYYPDGYGAWSLERTFEVRGADTPTIDSPQPMEGVDGRHTYEWHSKPGATWFEVYFEGPGGVYTKWMRADEGCEYDCMNADLQCSEGAYTIDCELVVEREAGMHELWVRGWSPTGFSDWSQPVRFTVQGPEA